MFKFAKKIGFKSTPFSSQVILASSFPVRQQLRYYKPQIVERENPAKGAAVVPDPALDELFYQEAGGAPAEVVDPWAIGPWNGGQPSLQYSCPPGGDDLTMIQQLKKDLNEGTIPDTSETRYHYKRSRRLFQRRLAVRKMGWVENNNYLTKTAKEEKDARDSAKDVKARAGYDFVVRPLFAYQGKTYSMESGTNVTKSAKTGLGADRSILMDIEGEEEDSTKKKKKKDKKF
jgi:hypothetical protein